MPILGMPGDSPVGRFFGDAPVENRTPAYSATYSHANEHAEPGYYSVKLDDGIGVELTANVRSGIARMSFPGGEKKHTILLDLSRNNAGVTDADIHIHGNSISGSVQSGRFCGADNHYRIYFALEFSQAPASYGTFDESHIYPGVASKSGARSGGYVSFGSSAERVEIKAALSYVSAKNAELNLHAELPGWNFDTTRHDAWQAWNDVLKHIEIIGGTPGQSEVFYTALYHALMQPSVFNDVNGEYIGFDDKIHTVESGRLQYANFSGWDIYRTQVQLIAMLFPKVGSDIAQSMVLDAEQGGGFPIWSVANDEAGGMVGDPGTLIVANLYAFGGKDFDTRTALIQMIRAATDTSAHSRLYMARPGLSDYLKLGYIPVSVANDPFYLKSAAATTLEETSADFAISAFANRLGDAATAKEFIERSANWRKLFDPGSGFIRPRKLDGDFLPDFTPASGIGFAEGTSAQYTWMIPYDMKGLINAVGGRENATQRLDDYLSQYSGGMHVNLGNEPSFGDPWIYNWTCQAWRTQQAVRRIVSDLFQPLPGGIPGNDDLGAMSSWLVLADLGLYPMIPGVGGVTLNSPLFPSVRVHAGNRSFRIEAPGAPSNVYIGNVVLDGKPISNNWVLWDQLTQSSALTFTLAPEPSPSFGGEPPSFSPGADR
jgi:predicted alpha-1,2-mannosidase